MSDRSDRGHRLLLATTARRWWVAIAAIMAVGVPLLLANTLSFPERTFVGANGPTQLLISVVTPVVAVLLAVDVHRGQAALGPAVRVAYLFAVVAGAWGAVFAAAAIAVSGTQGAWAHAVAGAIGGLVVQAVATTIGFGLGLAIPRPIVAGVATFSPLAVAVILGPLPELATWVTPAASAPLLLAGSDPLAWLRELVVLLIWGGGLGLVNLRRVGFGRERQRTT